MAPATRFRFRVESSFSVSGRGTAVIGTIVAGTVRVGDRLRLIGPDVVLTSPCVHVDAAPRVTGRAPDSPPAVALVVPDFDAGAIAEGDELASVEPVFCPRCGAVTELREDTRYCTRTGMDFSKVVGDELVRLVTDPPASVDRSDIKWGGRWNCPADGTRMSEADGRVTCGGCGRCLTRSLMYQLIELHVHR